jgi:2-isopropylmalate synthase
MKKTITLLDTTLRDGAQGENVNFSVDDKLNIVRALDDFGIAFIEAGNPASNPKDAELFARAAGIKLKTAKLIAFGSTRRKDKTCENDPLLRALAETDAEYASLVGKSHISQVTEILSAAPEENLRMIYESARYLKDCGKKVFFDAEHFFDGYKENPDYALKTLQAAIDAGVEALILCDTNGGSFPHEISDITRAALAAAAPAAVGIHCHNDLGCAAAGTFAAVLAGASHAQGTMLGIGERCGNADLITIIGGLQTKLGYACVPEESLENLTTLATRCAEIFNIKPPHNMPFAGKSAFSHKGGMHADGVLKNPASFEHIPPDMVGNKRRLLLSELAGRAAVLYKLREICPRLDKDSARTKELIDMLKEKEHQGFIDEAADASFEVLVKKRLGLARDYFEIVFFKVIGERSDGDTKPSGAMVKVSVGGVTEMAAAEGDGPVDAVYRALKQALSVFYPQIAEIHLTDYKVRVVDPSAATAAKVRVLISSTDGKQGWTTVGVSEDIIDASRAALVDSIEYKLFDIKE